MEDRVTSYGGMTLRIRPRPTTFVSRAEEDRLRAADFNIEEKLTPFSFRIRVQDADMLQPELQRARELGPAYHDYVIIDDDDGDADSSQNEFLLTDRLFVPLAHPPSDLDLAEVQGLHGR